jgi:phosphatidylinositol alpha-1,6-mannosyltransferase
MGEMREEQLLKCYQQCDLFALPNVTINGDFEGFGMVLVEAQACGKPVIAGRSGGTSEAMRDGETGRLVNCENESELASAVVALLSDEALRRRMGDTGRRWVERKFDWEAKSTEAQAVFVERFGKRMARRVAA